MGVTRTNPHSWEQEKLYVRFTPQADITTNLYRLFDHLVDAS
jgi:hypothetical protein